MSKTSKHNVSRALNTPKLPMGIILLFVGLIALAVVLYQVVGRTRQSSQSSQSSQTSLFTKTEDWNTYTSRSKRYTVKYPPGFRVSEEYTSGDGVLFLPDFSSSQFKYNFKQNDLVLISVGADSLPTGSTFDSLITKRLSQLAYPQDRQLNEPLKRITVQGYPAVVVNGFVDAGRTVGTFFMVGNVLYEISVQPIDRVDAYTTTFADQLEILYQGVLGTFHLNN